ncbi:hypothetical protein ACH5RR_029327 [Cinchona calisaya]|uniref:RNase H type-1 domain-containing protein n=1 Tax=Cinchona calisaya TaxID=153742 RepID=A0ABD2YSS3_9GENT
MLFSFTLGKPFQIRQFSLCRHGRNCSRCNRSCLTQLHKISRHQKNLEVECRALLYGLKLCQQHKFDTVQVEAESQALHLMASRQIKVLWKLDATLRHIQAILAQWTFFFQHIYREANSVADVLAN